MIPVFKPAIGPDTTKAATDALELGWLGMGSYVRDFEQALTEYLEIPPERKLVAVNTCTSALHLALLAAGVGPGDEVLTPALNNIGDFQAILMCGARPVFVDICESDLGIDPNLIERALSPRTKAVIALHYMGVPCRIDEVRAVARAHSLRVIEDAAHGTGTRHRARMVGSDGDLACFSFDAIKTLTCIDGGAVVGPASDMEKLVPARLLGMTQSVERLYANSRAYQFDVTAPGFRYHLANLHAAVGLSQLRRLPAFVSNRRAYARLYNALLGDIDGLVVPHTDFHEASVFHYVVRVLQGRRQELAQHLKERGVETGVHWVPGNRFSLFRDCRGANSISVTDKVGDEILTLPLWSYMDEAVIETVAGRIREFFKTPWRTSAGKALEGGALLQRYKRDGLIVPIPAFEGASLRAVKLEDPGQGDVELLSTWRNRHVKSFLTEFDATPARTRNWLVRQLGPDNSRIMFMIESASGVVGYVGLANIDWAARSGEADSVVRGRDSAKGLMSAALRALMYWAKETLGIHKFEVRVIEDNPALRFYEKFGFVARSRTPLAAVTRDDCIAWVPSTTRDSGARYLVHMELGNENRN